MSLLSSGSTISRFTSTSCPKELECLCTIRPFSLTSNSSEVLRPWCSIFAMNSQRENEKQRRNGQKRVHSTLFSSLSLLLSAVCCITVVRLEIKMNLQDRRISDSVTRCNQMETELQTLQRRRQGSDKHLLKTKGSKGKVFYHLFRLHRGHPVNWINYRRGCVAPSFTTLARPIWNETITLGFKI